MSRLARSILAIEPDDGWSPGAARRFEEWARASSKRDDLFGAEMEVLQREGHVAHTNRDTIPGFVALLSIWVDAAAGDRCTEAVRADAQTGDVGRVVVFPVAESHVRHAFPRTWPDGEQTPGLKKSTFWQANPAVGSTWRERYERHAQVARDHHSSAWQYRQNLLAPHGDPDGWDAVSELWWPTPDDLIERFYNSPESQAAVREDTVFVGRAMPIVTTHTVLRTAPPHASRSTE